MKAIRKPTEGFVFWTARIIVFVIRRCIIDRPGTELNSVCCLEYRPLPSRGGGGALRQILIFFLRKGGVRGRYTMAIKKSEFRERKSEASFPGSLVQYFSQLVRMAVRVCTTSL